MRPIHLGENCPCPSDCTRHGNCQACGQFHAGRGEKTYCEGVADPSDSPRVEEPAGAPTSGRQIRLLAYGACAG
ncbi:MAG TPA: hypothetical protein PKH31_07765 [Candidatus Sumerlaeota bacterium]|nr:hypothetical protein [Candidatus Sumerlaeota bacterium]